MSSSGNGKKKPSWNLPGPPPAWTLDFENQPELPPEGEYQGRIAEVKLSDPSQSTLWLFVNYLIDGIAAAPATEMGVLAVRDGSPYAKRLNDGRRLLYRVAAATSVQLSPQTDPYDLPALLEGKPVTLTIGHRVRDGMKELVVRKVSPPKS
jgi:hypothetical protein